MAEGSSPSLMHDARPTGSPHSSSHKTLAVRPRPRVLISSAPPGSLELLAARDRGSRHRDGRSSGGPGGSRGVVPPVPFPNTVVKRPSANDTAWATAWDNRPVPGPPLTPCCSIGYHSLIATRDGAVVARRAHNPKVVGSNPTPATNQGQRKRLSALSFCRTLSRTTAPIV
jgi:hypothetical protein